MSIMNTPSTTADILIIGAGLAGLTAALSLPAHLHITVLSKGSATECASAWAQGGIAAVLDASDSLESHVQDTLIAGAGLCDDAAVRQILAQGPAAIDWLQQQGVPFTIQADGALHLTREGGHSARRIAHAADRTGLAVHSRLLQICQSRSHIHLQEHCTAQDLLLDDGRCKGALMQRSDGSHQTIDAQHTIVATGGMGQIYPFTTNPASATGDGLAMAWRAGGRLRDLEFMQFHPTALQVDGRAVGLVSEALRGEGALLRLPGINGQPGERFMLRHDPRAELAPRDIVARAIYAEIREHGLQHVLLDITHQSRDWLARHFPGVMGLCATHGIDIATQPIPVAPCAHYACGGIEAAADGTTGVSGLSAIGEVARAGLHGANRLASNSLLECVVMGRAAAQRLAQIPGSSSTRQSHKIDSNTRLLNIDFNPETVKIRSKALQQLMHRHVGIVRSNQGLVEAAEQLALWRAQWQPMDAALRNQLELCALMVSAALQRHASVGAHCNSDWPAQETLSA